MVFYDHICANLFVFFDDILIYCPSFIDHLIHLHIILHLLASNKFYAKLSKGVFGVTIVAYLGHIVSVGASLRLVRRLV